jgi:drug/metabolite transporter (DMT)-like permease
MNIATGKLPDYSQAFIAACFALLLWSGTAVANKIAVGYMDAISAGVLRSLMAAIVALFLALSLQLPFPKSPREVATLFFSGITCFAVWPALFSLGIAHTTAGHAALIMALIPVFTVLIAAVLENRLPGMGWWSGAVLAVVGAAILIEAQTGSLVINTDGSNPIGDLTVLAGCVACSLGYVAGGKLSRKIGTKAVTLWGLAVTSIVLIPIFIALIGRTSWFQVPFEGWLALVWMALLSSIGGYVLWFFALGRGGIGRIGSLQLVLPVTTLASALVILHETLTLTLVLSCATIVTGTLIAHRHAH